MTPRLTEPPFENLALTELIAKGFGRGETPVADLVNAVQMVRGGSAGMAFGWPGIVDQTADAPSTFGVQFALPPTASEEFSGAQLVWQKQTLPEPVAYLGVAGRLMGVGRRRAMRCRRFTSARGCRPPTVSPRLTLAAARRCGSAPRKHKLVARGPAALMLAPTARSPSRQSSGHSAPNRRSSSRAPRDRRVSDRLGGCSGPRLPAARRRLPLR